MSVPKRLSVKFLVTNPPQPEQLVPIFQRWIQEHTVEGLLIDVANYAHVPNGPLILLIAHDGDYVYDTSDDEPGIKYIYKEVEEQTLADAIQTALCRAAAAVVALAAEETVDTQPISDGFQVELIDHLAYPNTHSAYQQAAEAVANLVEGATVQHIVRDQRRSLAIQLSASLELQQIAAVSHATM